MKLQLPQLTETDAVRQNQAIHQALTNRTLAAGSVTLTAGATSTTVTSTFVRKGDIIVLSPKTANAAGALGTTYYATGTDGQFTLTHANAVSVDRTFGWVAFGGFT